MLLICIWVELVGCLFNFLCYLLQYLGGFVISCGKFMWFVLVENVVMDGWCVIQWDKDDFEVFGLMKVDVFVFGMLLVLYCVFDLCIVWCGLVKDGKLFMLKYILQDDKVIYDMICCVDIVGVFQIELCVQMLMLLWLKLCNYYDFVVQVLIVWFGLI